MTKTIDKLLLGILLVFFIGMSAAFITAFDMQSTQDTGTPGQLVLGERSSSQVLDDDEDASEVDVPLTGSVLERASAAALAYIGEGRVTDSEIGDEEGYYEIEITLEDGTEVDVHLDENFNVLSIEREDEGDEDD
ncbi:MAG: hypothetical protein AABX53_01295 [Nanoarchaeota archaeon]